jgi:hypothetical protein
VDLGQRHFSGIFLNVFKPPIVNFAELWTFLLELDIEERMLFGEIEWIVGFVRNISWLFGRVIVVKFRGVLLVVIVVILLIVMLMIILMALLSH